MVYMNAQPGCTDPQALNFDPTALENNGTCFYPPTTYVPTQIAELPAAIPEASGAEFFDGQLWVHQDGGAGPIIHKLDTLTGAALQTYSLTSIENADWEDLAEDANYLYIGDFGNNGGNRTDLRIYKINKSVLLADTATAEVINFSFSDQVNFSNEYHAHNFDCEAFILLGDSLHIFSKRWLDFKTQRYTVPTTPGTHIAQLRDTLDVGFLTAAADVSDSGTVLLLGYDTLSVTSLWMLWDYPGTNVFAGNKRKISLGTAINMSQAEGIAFSSTTTGFICTEKLLFFPQRLLRFDIGQWLEGPSSTDGSNSDRQFFVSPNPFSEFLSIDFQGVVKMGDSVSVMSMDGRIMVNAPLRSGQNSLDTAKLPRGNYALIVKDGDEISVEKLVKQ